MFSKLSPWNCGGSRCAESCGEQQKMVFSDGVRKNKADGAKPGSIVTVIWVGHGDENGIYIGGKPLSISSLAGACAKFQTNTQLNLIIKACSSRAFAKAFRL